MKIISFLNFKGGVGKTTSTHCIGAALSELGKKVLLVDMDPQGTLSFFSTEEIINKSTFDLLLRKAGVTDCIMKLEEFDLIPSTIDLTVAELQLNITYNKEYRLKNSLSEIKENYDYILIDCPPSLSIFTLNSLVASTDLIIPCECELASMDGLNLLLKSLEDAINELNPTLNILGILPTKLDGRKKISGEIYEVL
ncbi:MAG: AAA family ATPase, partial [Cetobacterium sp.]